MYGVRNCYYATVLLLLLSLISLKTVVRNRSSGEKGTIWEESMGLCILETGNKLRIVWFQCFLIRWYTYRKAIPVIPKWRAKPNDVFGFCFYLQAKLRKSMDGWYLAFSMENLSNRVNWRPETHGNIGYCGHRIQNQSCMWPLRPPKWLLEAGNMPMYMMVTKVIYAACFKFGADVTSDAKFYFHCPIARKSV